MGGLDMTEAKLKDKVAVVAGGAKNLGGLISRQLAGQGAKIVVHYNSAGTRADAEATVASIKGSGGEAIAVQGDLTKPANVAALFAAAEQAFGGVDIAINTAGMVIRKKIVDITEAEFDTTCAINAKAAFFFIQEAGRRLRERGKICTIVTSLLAAYWDEYSIYAGTKAPVEHYTRAASKEFGARGISVTAVAPGPMDTPFFYGQETPQTVAAIKGAAALAKYTPSGLTHIEDIAPLVVFLVTDGWWITGQTIFANGGFTTR
jgi:NAD(P)-dependent dehydrogenase (short-subunit alcohol dehydrogenase family)